MINFLLTVLVLAGCGRGIGPAPTPLPPGPGPVPAPTTKVIIAAFGAPWCSACKSEIPKLQHEFDKLPADVRAQIEFRFYVTTGGNSSSPPDQDVADRYRDSLHLSAIAIPDPWKWQTFKKYVGGQFVIPGAGVVAADGSVLRQFRGGATFEPSEIVYFAAQAVKK